jgi:hypothetical protein
VLGDIAENAAVGVSGYVMLNGPGVWVCWDGKIGVLLGSAFVTSRRPDFRTLLAGLFESKAGGGVATFGEHNSMAAA